MLDAVKATGQVPEERFGEVCARISFFVNAGVRFVEEMCKMRAFTRLWDTLLQERYGVTDAKHRRFRYGVQVNSLGLTEAQPENNVQRIVLEMLGVTLSKDARARAVQLPAWNEALGLPRPWDQQWSLRLQQVLAYETDLLEYDDIFEGSVVIEAKVAALCAAVQAEVDKVQGMGGAIEAVEYMKTSLVGSHAERRRRIEAGEDVVVGVNRFTTTEPNPLLADVDGAILTVDPAVEQHAIEALAAWRAGRDSAAVDEALRGAARRGEDRRQPHAGHAGLRPRRGHHGGVGRCAARGLRRVPRAHRRGGCGRRRRGRRGHRRGPRPGQARPARSSAPGCASSSASPGLDGHSNGAEQIAVRGSRRRLRGRLPGHPPHARRRSSPPRSRRTSTSSACRSCPARTWRPSRPCSRGCARPVPGTCR